MIKYQSHSKYLPYTTESVSDFEPNLKPILERIDRNEADAVADDEPKRERGVKWQKCDRLRSRSTARIVVERTERTQNFL